MMAIGPNCGVALTKDSSLYELVSSEQKQNFIEEHKLSLWEFKKIENITPRAHDDALKRISVKLLNIYGLDKYLGSKYASLSDREFLQINSLEEEFLYDSMSRESALFISERLERIETKNTDHPMDLDRAIEIGNLTLGAVRGLTKESDFEKLSNYEARNSKRFNLALLSGQQKLSIKGRELFARMVNMHTRDHLQQFLPKMDPKEFNEQILNPKMTLWDSVYSILPIPDYFKPAEINLWNLPYGILPILDHSELTDLQFAELFRFHNIRDLDKANMDEDKLREFVHRVIHTTTVLHEVRAKIRSDKGEPMYVYYEEKKMVPMLDVGRLMWIPNSVFKIIDYTSLNKDEIFHLFHLGTKEHYEKMGHVVVVPGNTLMKFNFTLTGNGGSSWDEKSSKQTKQYNNYERLSQITPEQYESFRDKLCEEVQTLGDLIHRKLPEKGGGTVSSQCESTPIAFEQYERVISEGFGLDHGFTTKEEYLSTLENLPPRIRAIACYLHRDSLENSNG